MFTEKRSNECRASFKILPIAVVYFFPFLFPHVLFVVVVAVDLRVAAWMDRNAVVKII